MDETRIILSGIWVALMLTYLLGDMFRLYSGDFNPGRVSAECRYRKGCGLSYRYLC